jgi:hypothetical protein
MISILVLQYCDALLGNRDFSLVSMVKHSYYRYMGSRGLWEVKASRFRDIGT